MIQKIPVMMNDLDENMSRVFDTMQIFHYLLQPHKLSQAEGKRFGTVLESVRGVWTGTDFVTIFQFAHTNEIYTSLITPILNDMASGSSNEGIGSGTLVANIVAGEFGQDRSV